MVKGPQIIRGRQIIYQVLIIVCPVLQKVVCLNRRGVEREFEYTKFILPDRMWY
jgi:hypothetical protein